MRCESTLLKTSRLNSLALIQDCKAEVNTFPGMDSREMSLYFLHTNYL